MATILVVDDDPDIRSLLTDFLKLPSSGPATVQPTAADPTPPPGWAVYSSPHAGYIVLHPGAWQKRQGIVAPQPGDRILVLGQLLVDGSVRVEYLAVERQAAWGTWFRKRLFELGSDQLDPLLLDRYVSTPPEALGAPDLWLLGTVQQVLPLVVAVDGKSLAPGDFTARLEDRALAYGVLDKPGNLQVRLVRLFVQDEPECATWDQWEHCPHWTELYPPGTPAPSTGPTSVPAGVTPCPTATPR